MADLILVFTSKAFSKMKNFMIFGAILFIAIAGILLLQQSGNNKVNNTEQAPETVTLKFKDRDIDVNTSKIELIEVKAKLDVLIQLAVAASKSGKGIDENTYVYEDLKEDQEELKQQYDETKSELEKLKNELRQKELKCEQITDPTEREECQRELEQTKEEVKEKEAELSDLKEAMRILSTILKLAGYACAMGGQVQWAAGCFVAAGILDQAVGETAPGPTREEASRDSGKTIPDNPGPQAGPDSGPDPIDKPSVPADERFIVDLDSEGWSLEKTGGRNGEWRIARKGRIFAIYEGSSHKATIDFFQKNTDAMLPKEWTTIRNSGYELTYIDVGNKANALLRGENGKWELRN